MTVTTQEFKKNGITIVAYTIKSSKAQVTILDYGCTLSHFVLNTKEPVDILLGYDDPFDYIESPKNPYFGALVGRSCNRTQAGKFELNSKAYQLPINNGPNSLHGGLKGFDKQFWTAQVSESSVKFSLQSPHGDQGYPGAIQVSAVFTLSGSELVVETTAELVDSVIEETYVNLTSHPYFNLSGKKANTIEAHKVMMNVKGALQMDSNQIPTGKILTDDEAPELFFTNYEPFSAKLPQVQEFRGFDHFYLVKNAEDCITISEDDGVSLTVSTDCAGFQLYTGNWIEEQKSKATHCGNYGQYSGFCVEPSQPPNAINMKEYRHSVIVTKAKPWKHYFKYNAKF